MLNLFIHTYISCQNLLKILVSKQRYQETATKEGGEECSLDAHFLKGKYFRAKNRNFIRIGEIILCPYGVPFLI